MINKSIVLSIVVAYSCASMAANLTTPIPPSLWVASDHNTQAAVGPAVGSLAVSSPSWAVLQWYVDVNGNTLTMPTGKRFVYMPGAGGWNNGSHNFLSGTNSKWSLANSAAVVAYDAENEPWLGGVYKIDQNGQDLPSPCGGESDLFLSPKGPLNNFGPLANSAPNGFTQNGPLSSLTSLNFHAGLNIAYENIIQKCQNVEHNKINYVLGVFLRNTSNNKTFFYQLVFRSSLHTNSANGWYGGFVDSFGNAGVDDYIDNIGYARPTVSSGRIAYSGIDLLPRLKEIISKGWAYNGAGPAVVNFDSNLANWRIDGMFVGQAMWGGVIASSQWDNILLQAYP